MNREQILQAILKALKWVSLQLAYLETNHQPPAPVTPSETPVKQPPANVTIKPNEKPMNYDFSTPEAARHSCRVIADEEGLTIAQKNLMSQVIHCESGYNIHAKHPNLGIMGKVFSTDFGICQWNDKYHGTEITPDEAENNPEKAVRLMCQYVKRGQIKLWVCYSSNLYKKYSA